MNPQIIASGGKLFAQCADCGNLVRLNKPFLGSLHICLTEEEIATKRRLQQMRPRQVQTPLHARVKP